MGTADVDRQILVQDKRFSTILQAQILLPKELTARRDGLSIDLRQDTKDPTMRTLVRVLAGDELLNEIRTVSLQQPFTVDVNGSRTEVILVPRLSYTDGKMPVGHPVSIITKSAFEAVKDAFGIDQRVQNLSALMNKPGFDPRPFVSDTYGEIADNMEDSVAYLRRGVELHKQALQNAVDIVQSKRLAFLEAGSEPNWSGVLFMIGFVFFIELAAVPVAAIIFSNMISGLSRVSPNAARAVIGVTKAREMEKTIAAIKNHRLHFKAFTNERAAIDRIDDMPETKEIYRFLIDKMKTTVKENKIRLVKQEAEVHQQVAELLKSGAGSEHLTGVGKLLSAQNVKTAAKSAKEASGPFAKKTASKRPKQNVTAELPLDIVLKTTIQSVLDDNLWHTERLLADTKLIARRARFANPDNTEDKKHLLNAVTDARKLHLGVLELEESLADLRELFDTDGMDALSVNLTKEYELKIWILLYATRYTKHRALQISSAPSRTGGVSQWIYPVTKEQDESYDSGTYIRTWRDIDRDTYDKYEKDSKIVTIVPQGDARRRKALFDYLRARFTWDDGNDDDAIANQFADMHAAMHKNQKKSGLSPEELNSTGITWTHAIGEEEDEGEKNE